MSTPKVRGLRNPTAVWILSYTGKRGKSYRIRWVDPTTGLTQNQSVGHDLALARFARDQKKAELRDGLSGRIPEKRLSELRQALDGFMAGKAVVTISKVKLSLKLLEDACGDVRLANVNKSLLMKFRQKRSESTLKRTGKCPRPATLNRDMRHIKSALSYAADAGWLRSNPLWRWRGMLVKEPEKRIRVIEPKEFNAILEKCENPTLRVMFIVAYAGGLRRTELVNLRWGAVDFDKGMIRIENNVEAGELTKSRRNRTVPLSGDARRELKALHDASPKVIEAGTVRMKHEHCFVWPDGSRYLADWVTREFTRIVGEASIPHATLHDLRRSFSTLAQRAGIDASLLQRLGGWSDLATVRKHYTGQLDEAERRAIDQLSRAQGAVG